MVINIDTLRNRQVLKFFLAYFDFFKFLIQIFNKFDRFFFKNVIKSFHFFRCHFNVFKSVTYFLKSKYPFFLTFFDKLSFNKLAPTVRVDAETVKPTVKEHFRKYLAFKARSVIKSLFKALIARLNAVAVIAEEIAEHHIGRIFYDCVVHIHKCFRLDPIVAVDKADIVTARGRNSRLSCAEQTAVLLMHNLHARVLSRIFVANLGAAVGRTVIDYDYFNIVERLRREAVKALAEIIFNFVYRHYNAYHKILSP